MRATVLSRSPGSTPPPGQDRASTQLLTEMVTRSSKWILNSRFRKEALGVAGPSWGSAGASKTGAGPGSGEASGPAVPAAHAEAVALLSAIFPTEPTAHLTHALAMYDGNADLAANWLSENPAPSTAAAPAPDNGTATAGVVAALNHVLGNSVAANNFWQLLIPLCLRVKFGSHQPALTAGEASGVRGSRATLSRTRRAYHTRGCM